MLRTILMLAALVATLAGGVALAAALFRASLGQEPERPEWEA